MTRTKQSRAFLWGGGIATALAASYAFNRWSAARAEAQTPPPGNFVTVDGVRLHYVERGTGTPIVLIHGSGSLVQDFIVSGLFDALAENHRVIAFDRPGYGWSTRPRGEDWPPERQADLMVAACAEIGADMPIVVGHSWGTLPAIAWALDHPGTIAGLVLISGYYYPTPRPDAVLTGIAALPVIGDLLTHTILPLQMRITGPLGLKMIFSPDAVPEGFTDAMPTGLMLRPSQLHATNADSGEMPIAAARLAARYPELTLPMTIIWGDGDKLVGQEGQSQRLAESLPHASALGMANAGHMLHHIQTEEVVSAVTNLMLRV